MDVQTQPERRLIANEHFLAPRLFSVVTWGCAASDWLANSLNDCPGIFAVHHSNNLWSKFGGARTLSGIRYLEIVGMQGHAALAAGDIHGISRSDIQEIRAEYADIFRAVVLVRHPLPRLRSQVAFFNEFAHTKAWDVTYVPQAFPQIVKGLPTGSYEELLFVHGVNLLNSIIEEVAVGPIYRMEDLTTNSQVLIGLVDYLSAGTVSATDDWAARQTGSRGTNQHSHREKPQFSTWQRRVLADLFDPAAIELYRKLDYDVEPLGP